jgi:hypothetical protein
MRWLAVVRDIALVILLTFLAGFVIGFSGAQGRGGISAVALGNLVFGTIGFTISGCLANRKRWRHLAVVAVGVWLLGLVNLAGRVTLFYWIFSAIPVALMMIAGGALSYALVRSKSSADSSNRSASVNPGRK